MLRNRNLMVVFVPVPVIIQKMKRAGKTTIWALISVLLGVGAEAVTPGTSPNQTPANQYQGIVDRNVFNLRPPPAPVNPADLVKKEAPPKVTLDGITTILGKKETFLSVPPTKPGTPAQTLMLAEGQAEDDVEVTSIDERAGVVKVINHGESETLDFDHNGTKPVAPTPGNPSGPVTIPPIPAPAPANVQPFPNVIRPIRTLPTRSPGGPFGGGGNPNGGAEPMGGGVIGEGASGPMSAGIAAQNQAVAGMTPEQIDTIIEAQRLKAIQENDPMAKMLPPTEHTPDIEGLGQAAQ